MTAMDQEDVPVYLRLRAVLAAFILEGRYGEGEQLPSVRAFATKMGANPLTVAKAYQCLQDEGHVTVKRGVGMFVAEGAIDRLRVKEREIFLTRIWPRIHGHIERLGIRMDELSFHQST
jgi:GntR family transcriptional regulator